MTNKCNWIVRGRTAIGSVLYVTEFGDLTADIDKAGRSDEESARKIARMPDLRQQRQVESLEAIQESRLETKPVEGPWCTNCQCHHAPGMHVKGNLLARGDMLHTHIHTGANVIMVYHFPVELMRYMVGHDVEKLKSTVRDNLARYHHVATVYTDDFEIAFERTNTVNSSWWKNEGVQFHGSSDHGMAGARSTSIGDVLELNGKRFVVASIGTVPLDA